MNRPSLQCRHVSYTNCGVDIMGKVRLLESCLGPVGVALAERTPCWRPSKRFLRCAADIADDGVAG